MPSLTNLKIYRSPMPSSKTSSILIKNSRKSRSRLNEPWTNDNSEISSSAQNLYDSATWRMYYRIRESRRRREQAVIQDRNIDGSVLARSRDCSGENDSYSKKAINKAKSDRKERQRQRSLSACSDSSQAICDEGIFTLDL